jgi:hypothetical protein
MQFATIFWRFCVFVVHLYPQNPLYKSPGGLIMEKYPKLSYEATCFSACSSSEFELYVEGLEGRYGPDILNYWLDDETIAGLVAERTVREKREITIYYVKEILRELHLRCFEKQFI